MREHQCLYIDRSSTGVLTWTVPNALAFHGFPVLLESVYGFLRAAHVASFGNELGTSFDETLRFVTRDFILGCAGESNIDLAHLNPWSNAVDVFVLSLKRDDGSPKLDGLERSVLGDVAGS